MALGTLHGPNSKGICQTLKMDEYKQVIVVRTDISMPPGKAGAQIGHAVMSSYLAASKKARDIWTKHGQTKIVVKISSERELIDLYHAIQEAGVPCALIRDEGRTVFHGQITTTCLGIGPAPPYEIDKFTGHLRLY